MVHSISFDLLPMPALLTDAGTIVAANAAYIRFTGFDLSSVIGRNDVEFAAQVFVPDEHVHLAALVAARNEGVARAGDVWAVLRFPVGDKVVRLSWTKLDETRMLISLFELGDDGRAKVVSDALARAAGLLGECSTEQGVLARAAEALFARGVSVAILLIQQGDPLLTVGPTLGVGDERAVAASLRLPVRHLYEENPAFDLRKAVFINSARAAERTTYDAIKGLSRLPLVQAPLFVDDQPYGAIVATSDTLTPGFAGAIEMFTELVARAIEGVRRRAELAQRLDELRQLQAERVGRERLAALGEAAAMMAHEVRNPVAAMLNAVTLLRKDMSPAVNREVPLEIIDEEAHRLDRIVRDLIDLGRTLVPRARNTTASELLNRGLRLLEKRGDLRSVSVSIDGNSSARVFVDPDLIELAIENILRNAVQACGPSGRIAITVHGEGDRVVVTVDDSGPGIADELRARVFEPFFSTRATGTGLGLAVVRRVVEANRGSVDVGESTLGGARLRIELPAAAQDGAPSDSESLGG